MIFKNWPFFLFRRKITHWAESGLFPPSYKLPVSVKLSRSLYKTIREIKKNTAIDGSERAVTVLDIDGLLLTTSAIIGESERVLLKHKFKVNYSYERQTQRCFREIYRDDRLIIKDYFMAKNPPRKINLRVLFNIHTHPHGELANFFSKTDLEGFLGSQNVPAMVLVASDIWLLLKSNKTQSFSSLDFSGSLIKKCQEAGFSIYKGKIGERLRIVG